MKATKEERKQKALEIMKKMDIFKPYRDGFENNNQVCYFEYYAGFWADQEPELYAKIKEIENEFDLTVYAVTHEYLEFGECYSLLYVGKEKSEWKYTVESHRNVHYAFAYVWNKTDDMCSEFGTVGVQSFGGGITRIC